MIKYVCRKGVELRAVEFALIGKDKKMVKMSVSGNDIYFHCSSEEKIARQVLRAWEATGFTIEHGSKD